MANKFEIIGGALVISDTTTDKEIFETAKGDAFYDVKALNNEGLIHLFDISGVNQRSSGLHTSNLADAVDATNTPFKVATFKTEQKMRLLAQ